MQYLNDGPNCSCDCNMLHVMVVIFSPHSIGSINVHVLCALNLCLYMYVYNFYNYLKACIITNSLY